MALKAGSMASKLRPIDAKLCQAFAEFESEYESKMKSPVMTDTVAESLGMLMRKRNEQLVKWLVQKYGLGDAQIEEAFHRKKPGQEYWKGSTFAALIALEYYGIISREAANAMHSVRTRGNVASHADSKEFKQSLERTYDCLSKAVDGFADAAYRANKSRDGSLLRFIVIAIAMALVIFVSHYVYTTMILTP